MTFKQFSLAILAFFTLLMASCKKEVITSDHRTNSFSAFVKGQAWDADSSFSIMDYDADRITIQGQTAERVITMTLEGTAKGQFDLDNSANNLVLKTPTTEYQYINGTGGHVELTLNDKVEHALSGKFSGMLASAEDTLIIDQGIFSYCKYVDTTSNPAGGGGGGGGTTGGICDSDEIGGKVDGGDISGLLITNITEVAGAIIIQSINTQLSGVTLTIPSVEVGTYDVTGTTVAALYNEGTSSYPGLSGTITITESDTEKKSIKGTFSFSAKEAITGVAKEITDGTFCVSYN